MNTKVETAPAATVAKPAPTDNLPAIARERIPYHPAMQERFGVDRTAWRALVEAVWPSAKTVEGVLLAMSYCKARNLDPFKRPVHVVPIWNAALGKEVETVWPGIGELRTTAIRTGQWAGADECKFGDDRKQKFSGDVGRGENRKHVDVEITFPEWAQLTVYRLLGGQRVPFPGPKVYWMETYSTIGRSDVPNDMWQGRPRGQLEKCAEAAALRRAFPEEVGSEYIAEEVDRRTMVDIGGSTTTQPEAPPPRPKREDYEPFDLYGDDGVLIASYPSEADWRREFVSLLIDPTVDYVALRQANETLYGNRARVSDGTVEAIQAATASRIAEAHETRAQTSAKVSPAGPPAVEPADRAHQGTVDEAGDSHKAGNGPKPAPIPNPPFEKWTPAMWVNFRKQTHARLAKCVTPDEVELLREEYADAIAADATFAERFDVMARERMAVLQRVAV